LPVRVAANDDGTYEVLDGFKRVTQWRGDGDTHVPVVVEDAAGVVRKARLLEANAPRRTVSPMDEARVVRSLADDDQLTPPQIAKLLGRGRSWVNRRLTLGRRLAPVVAGHLDAGRLSATIAYRLAAFPRAEQPRLADARLRHGLRTREGDAFLEAWRVADDASTREALLRDPRSAVPAPQDPAVSPLGPTARELQARFDQTARALAELLHLDFTAFADPDRRVLEACQFPRSRKPVISAGPGSALASPTTEAMRSSIVSATPAGGSARGRPLGAPRTSSMAAGARAASAPSPWTRRERSFPPAVSDEAVPARAGGDRLAQHSVASSSSAECVLPMSSDCFVTYVPDRSRAGSA
jgi:ParB-like chromosome segregation protein Spo0J